MHQIGREIVRNQLHFAFTHAWRTGPPGEHFPPLFFVLLFCVSLYFAEVPQRLKPIAFRALRRPKGLLHPAIALSMVELRGKAPFAALSD